MLLVLTLYQATNASSQLDAGAIDSALLSGADQPKVNFSQLLRLANEFRNPRVLGLG